MAEWRNHPSTPFLRLSDEGEVEYLGYRLRHLLHSQEQKMLVCFNSHRRSIAVLMLEAFGQPRPSTAWRVGYKDGDFRNFRLSNLRWERRAAKPPAFVARNEAIHYMRSCGARYSEIARAFNLSHQRVHVIVNGRR